MILDNPSRISLPMLEREVQALNATTGDTLAVWGCGYAWHYVPGVGHRRLTPAEQTVQPLTGRGYRNLALVRLGGGEAARVALNLNTRQMWWFLMGMRLEATGGFAFALDTE